MQAATVRRVDADCLLAPGGGGETEARIGAAFSAMSMNDIAADGLGALRYVPDSNKIADPDVAAHRHARDAQRQRAREPCERGFRLRPAGRLVGDQPDPMSARGLTRRQIGDVAKQ